MIDLARAQVPGKLPAGSDPEQFAVSADGTHLYVSNEDVATASVMHVADGKVEHIIPVKKEPEGVSVTPDGQFVYVTCETGGEVFVIDATRTRRSGRSTSAGGRAAWRSLPDGSRAFVPSESAGLLHVIDTATPQGDQDDPPAAGLAADGDGHGAGRQDALRQHRPGRGGLRDRHGDRLEVADMIQVGGRPWGVAISPDGQRLYVADGPTNDVVVVDLKTNKERSASRRARARGA